MKLTETLRSLGRRWYIVVLGLALTLGMSMLLNVKVPTTFQATGTILLMPPDATVGVQGNPYLWLGGLNTALDVLVRRSSAMEVSGPLMAQYPDAGFTILPDRTTSSAIVLVTTNGATAEMALQLRDDGMAAVIKTLGVMQDESSVKDDLRIHGKELVVDKTATPETKTRLQLLIVVGAGGTVGSLLLAGLIDGWIMERRLRKGSDAPPPPRFGAVSPENTPSPGDPSPRPSDHQPPVPAKVP